MSAVLAIVGKDLRQGVRDRSVFLFGLVVPLGLAMILNVVFGNLAAGGSPMEGRTFAIVDLDGGDLAGQIATQALPSAIQPLGVDVVLSDDEDDTRLRVENGEIAAAFVIPSGFSAVAEVSGPGRIDVVTNADQAIVGDVAVAIAEQFATRLTGTQVAVATALSTGADPGRAGEIAAAASQVVSPVQLVDTGVDPRQLDVQTGLAAGLLIFFLFFTVQIGVVGYLREREVGTLPRLLAGPLTRWHVVLAKVLTSFTVGMASVASYVVAATLLLGADFGPVLPVAVLAVGGVASAVGLVAVVTAFARTAEQAGNLSAIIAIVLGMLGGSFFPTTTGTGLVATLGRLTPHGQFLEGLGDIQADPTVAGALPSALSLLVLGAVFLTAGGWAVNRRATA